MEEDLDSTLAPTLDLPLDCLLCFLLPLEDRPEPAEDLDPPPNTGSNAGCCGIGLDRRLGVPRINPKSTMKTLNKEIMNPTGTKMRHATVSVCVKVKSSFDVMVSKYS